MSAKLERFDKFSFCSTPYEAFLKIRVLGIQGIGKDKIRLWNKEMFLHMHCWCNIDSYVSFLYLVRLQKTHLNAFYWIFL